MNEGKITIKLSREGMLSIKQYCEIVIRQIGVYSSKTQLSNKANIINYAKAHAATYELKKVCEKMNKATYLRGFDTRERNVSISAMQGYCVAFYSTFYELETEIVRNDYSEMIIRSTIDTIWKELTK